MVATAAIAWSDSTHYLVLEAPDGRLVTLLPPDADLPRPRLLHLPTRVRDLLGEDPWVESRKQAMVDLASMCGWAATWQDGATCLSIDAGHEGSAEVTFDDAGRLSGIEVDLLPDAQPGGEPVGEPAHPGDPTDDPVGAGDWLAQLRGTWELAGEGVLTLEVDDVLDLDEPTEDDDEACADGWLAGEHGGVEYTAAHGRTLTIGDDGTFTETGSGDGLARPYAGRLERWGGRVLAFCPTDDSRDGERRMSGGDDELVESFDVDGDGDLVRLWHLVTDGMYLTRQGAVYRRATQPDPAASDSSSSGSAGWQSMWVRTGRHAFISADGAWTGRVTGREHWTLTGPSGTARFWADHGDDDLWLSEQSVTDASGQPLADDARREALGLALHGLRSIGERAGIWEQRPGERDPVGDVNAAECRPTDAIALLRACLGHRVVSIRRCEQDDAHRDADGQLEAGEGPILVELDHGLVLAVGAQSSWQSLTVWVERDTVGTTRPGGWISDPDKVSLDLADPRHSTLPTGSLGSRLAEWRLAGSSGARVLVLGTTKDPLAICWQLPDPRDDIRVIPAAEAAVLTRGMQITRVE